MLQRVERCVGGSVTSRRKELIRSCFWDTVGGGDTHSLFRLLLPHNDKERVYGIREHMLARLVVAALGLAETSGGGRALCYWQEGELRRRFMALFENAVATA